MSAAPATSASRVLVTGAGGFIGSHVVDAFLREGRPVRALVRYTSEARLGHLQQAVDRLQATHAARVVPEVGTHAFAVGPLEVVLGDVTDAAQMRGAVRGCDAVCHLAALIGIPYSYVAVGSYVDVNVRGTLHLLEAAREAGVRRFVHTSTSEVYGSAQSVPITLAHPLVAQSPYAATKIGADQLALSFARSFGLGVLVLRPFNTYGPRQSQRAVVPTIVAQALAGGALRLGSTDTVRDLTFVEDTARAFVLAADAPAGDAATVQLGTGQGVAIREVVEAVGRVVGRRLDVETDAGRVRPAASEVSRLVSDPSSAKTTLGWTAEVGLDEGVRRTVAWMRDHPAPAGPAYRV
jgi:nucleoside-diphosphate-sugar epimerase